MEEIMNNFMKVLNDVHEFIVGRVETTTEKSQIGFTTDKPKRKYTRRKKTTTKKNKTRRI